jgi:hypothetical protein
MYQPILKGKQAEYVAWENASAHVKANAVPLFEVVPKDGVDVDLAKALEDIARCAAPNNVIAVDCGFLDQTATVSGTSLRTVSWLGNQLSSRGVRVRPVVRLDDPAAVVRDAVAVSASSSEAITMRVGGPDADPSPSMNDTSLSDFCAKAQIAPSDVHLLIDLGSSFGKKPSAEALVAELYVRWAVANGPWRTVTLASGAFPSSITDYPTSADNRLERADALIWNQVNSLQVVPNLVYGDYAINHPDLPAGRGGRPYPGLRYASGSEWIIWREKFASDGTHVTFYDLCAGICALPDFSGTAYSWGDRCIEEKSRKVTGPGTGTQWRSYGTSHHIAHVVDRLTNLGVA